jgi:CRISPR-associated endonuclease Csn1
MTANLRHKWGLNSILNDDNNKSRDDHRHHAIDALVMACATRSHLQELSKWNRYNRNYDLKDFSMPWASFWQDAEKAVNEILVSHKKHKNLLTVRKHKTKKEGVSYTNTGIAARGQLHKETVFGKRKAPNKTEAYHIRKPIESLTTQKHIDKIVDDTIRLHILKRVNELGGFVKGKIPEGTFYQIDENGIKKAQVFLPNKNGAPVPIKKIRMRENIGGAEKLKENVNQYVNPRNNHHVLIYEDIHGNLKEDVVTFWTAIERKRQKQDVIQLPFDGKKIITTLQINDMFLLGLNEEEINWDEPNFEMLKNHLYRVQKLSSKFHEFRLNTESKIDKKEIPFYRRITGYGKGVGGWNTHTPVKIKINCIGKIEKM